MRAHLLQNMPVFRAIFACGLILAMGCGYDSDWGGDTQILAPTEGAVFVVGEVVLLEGAIAEDLSVDAFAWFSDRDGYLGSELRIQTDALSAGEHVIRFSAYGDGLELGSAEVRIMIHDQDGQA